MYKYMVEVSIPEVYAVEAENEHEAEEAIEIYKTAHDSPKPPRVGVWMVPRLYTGKSICEVGECDCDRGGCICCK